MAQLSQLEAKLAEVIGLAQASQDTTRKVTKMVSDDEVKTILKKMQAQSKETADRGLALAGHVEIVRTMNEQVRDKEITKLATWALKVQSRHFEQSRAAALKPAAQEDATQPE
jgi:hypothetical protein